jgi:hypothetical protein
MPIVFYNILYVFIYYPLLFNFSIQKDINTLRQFAHISENYSGYTPKNTIKSIILPNKYAYNTDPT